MEPLEGWGDPINVNQVRMDVKGQVGVIIAITSDGIIMQRSERSLECIPADDAQIFEETTFSLGEL